MSFRPGVVLTLYGKEMRETLRDRRTIVVMILLPLTLYPLLTVLFASVAAAQRQKETDRPSQVCLSGPHSRALEQALSGPGPGKIALATGSCAEADLRRRSVQAILEVPAGFDDALTSAAPEPARILYDENEDVSRLAMTRVRDRVIAYAQARRSDFLHARGLPGALVSTQPAETRSVTSARENGAALLAKILPILVIFMVVLGAFYPAIDLTAGERERGTLETLLSAPVEPIEVIVGKWLATATIATVTGFLNLGSMALTVGQMLHLAGAEGAAAIVMPWSSVLLSGLAIIPSALFFAALFMAVAALARSYKEAQSLVMPVYLAVSLPATFAAMPGVELQVGTAVVPGAGVALLVKGIIQARLSTGPTVAALVSMLAYAGVALILAARIYTSEEAFAGEGAQGRLGDRLRALLVGPARAHIALRPAPSPAEAMTLFSLVVLLLFFVATPLQQRDLVRGLLLTQWAVLLGATLLFLRVQAIDVRQALGLRRPTLRACGAAVLMGASAWLLLSVLIDVLLARILPMQRLAEDMKRTLMASPRSLWFDLFLIAASPAVCEELLFRGAILSGLRRGLRPWTAALACGALFGIFHLHGLRVLPTALLGIILAWLAMTGRSIVPAMIFHFLNNGAAVVVTRLNADAVLDPHGRVGLAALAIAALAFATGVLLLRPAARALRAAPGPATAAES
ncbi:MAG TPA: ABC transporter permease subunit/CPBP intramembrane protease [Polyangia bacterium]|nr:ABC transporter permease subunit/CPBP intramembrane protease [Polyangia bacterium]